MGDTVVPNTLSEPPAKAFSGAAYCGGAISADGSSIGSGYYRELKGINPGLKTDNMRLIGNGVRRRRDATGIFVLNEAPGGGRQLFCNQLKLA